MLNEQQIITTLKKNFPDRGGIGDDAAILPLSRTHRYLISQDILVENIHFRRSYFSASDLAHKILHINMSDIVAMGGTPTYLFLTMAIPPSFERELSAFVETLTQVCRAHHVTLMGGDTTASSQGVLMMNATIVGKCALKHIKRRRGAKKGDIICIAGSIGHAHLGFQALERGYHSPYETCFLRPTARVAEGIWLGQQASVTTMMDISDGLWIDLKRLCAASHAVATLNLRALAHYQDDTFIHACKQLDPLSVQLTGGEDYSLLCTLRPRHWLQINTAFTEKFGYPLKKIGQIIKQRHGYTDIILTDGEKVVKSVNFTIKPFTHFGEPVL